MRRMSAAKPHKRDGIWYLVRRVPKEFVALDRRGLVRVSTNIAVADDPRAIKAGPMVAALGRELEAYWRGLRDGKDAEARQRFDAAQKRAQAMGLPYLTNAELAEAPIEEIKRHISTLLAKGSVEDEVDVAAALGGESKPSLVLGDLVKEFEDIQDAALRDYSPNQRKKWRAPRDRVVALWIALVGDLALTSLRRSHSLQLRSYFSERIVTDKMDIGTANTMMGALAKMLKEVNIVHELGLPDLFRGLRFAGEVDGHRAAFEVKFIQDVILADGALDGLNGEARAIVWLAVECGLRLSEAANLLPAQICLDHKVPHVQVRPIGRKLKTEQSERDVPLVGTALVAMKLHPAGFPRYRDKGASLSAVLNKYMRTRKMLPTDNHSVYSLRHALEDRLTAVEAPEKVIAALMGHKYSRPKYGAGPSLEQKREWLQRIALTPPEHFGPFA